MCAACSAATAQDSATFQYIVEPFNKYPAVSANDMSPDGRWVVGSLDTNADGLGDTGYRWDRLNDEFTLIPTEIIGTGDDPISAVSDDGQVILGSIAGGVDGVEATAGIWTEAGGWVSLGYLPNAGSCPSRSNGYELSGDGTTAVGLSWDGCSGRGFVWTEETGMLELEPMANGGNRASVVSSDGSVIAGFSQGFTRTPTMWNGFTLDGELLDPTLVTGGEFQGISDDGTILLGSWWMGGTSEEAGKIVNGVQSKIGAGALLPGWSGIPLDIADNGTIVGFDFLLGNRRSWIQPFGKGDLQLTVDFIRDLGADVVPGTRLEVLQAISTDGKSIIGHSIGSPAFLITLDYPCQADLTNDDSLNFLDVSAFLTAFGNQDPIADFEADGSFNFLDVSAFLAAFGAGCP